MKRCCFYLFLLLLCMGCCVSWHPVQAQDTVVLREVRVETHRLAAQPGVRTLSLDSNQLQLAASLSDALASTNRMFITNYGANGLSTISWRGMGPERTALVWNGFNLQSPMNGQLDLNLLPVVAMDEVGLQSGASGALYGSSAVGGVLHMNNKPEFDQGWHARIDQSVGSFGLYQGAVGAGWSGKKYTGEVRWYTRQAENDYPFFNRGLADAPRDTLENARFEQSGLLTEHHWLLSDRQSLSVVGWWQTTDRELPAVETASPSTATQADESIRMALTWKRYGKHWVWSARTGLLTEDLQYVQPEADLISDNASTSWITEGEGQWQINDQWQWTTGINSTLVQAEADGYAGQQQVWRKAVFSALSGQKGAWSWEASVRQEWNDTLAVPITPSAGFAVVAAPGFTIRAQASRTYRLPTFNELFWEPGGNSDLLAESGWSTEMSFEQKLTLDETKTVWAALTPFSIWMDNQIQWIPDGLVWTPINIRSVWSRGLEAEAGWNHRLGPNTSFSGAVNGQWVRATEQGTSRQMRYVPEWQGGGRLMFSWHDWQLSYQHSVVSLRYTLSDNAQSLDAYQVGQAQLRWQGKWHNQGIHLFAQLNNAWNEDYRVLAFRPMPLRNGSLGLRVLLNTKKQ